MSPTKEKRSGVFGVLQRVGRSFMLPIALLPIAGLLLGIGASFTNPAIAIPLLTLFTFLWTVTSYLNGILTAAYIFIIEHRRIMEIKWYKKVWFCITFPIFEIIGRLSMYVALFSKVEWKPTPHRAGISISELKNKHRK